MTAHRVDTLTRSEHRFETMQTRTRGSLPSWRTPARRRLLVRLNRASLAIMAAIAGPGHPHVPRRGVVLAAAMTRTMASEVADGLVDPVADRPA